MQSDVPPLPISCLTDNIRLRRNSSRSFNPRLSTQDSSNKSCKSNLSTVISTNRKHLRPIVAGPSPYKNSARLNSPDTAQSSGKSVIGQRVCSAKMLRIKQLQNQLADAHFHLNELSNENKLLKAIQKRQDAALKRYEGSNAELPRIINTHHEDLRVLQNKFKKLKSQYKEASETLKQKETELHSLQVQNKKLLQLSKDRHLGEREKLQMQVMDLNHRINQQDEIIQTLKKKLALESKYLKHQLHAEMTKHKETQKQLEETQSKLKRMEELAEQREKRSYHARHIIFYNNRDRPTITSQSLTNLYDHRTENLIKGHSFRRRRSEATGQSLPSLNEAIMSFTSRSQSQETSQKSSQEAPLSMTETLINYEQVKNFRLQKSPALHRAAPFSTSRGSLRDSPIKESQLEGNDIKENRLESFVNEGNAKKTYELPKALKKEFDYESDDNTSSKDDLLSSSEKINDSFNLTNRSRLLHARLVSSATEGVRTNKIPSTSRSRSLTKENMENIIENEKAEMRYDRDSVITVISRDTLIKEDADTATNYSNSDIESEMEIPIEFNKDEDDNVIRKSDINIESTKLGKQSNTSSHLSKMFSQLAKAPNYSSDEKDNNSELNKNVNNDKFEFQSINGLLTNTELFSQDVDKSIDNLRTQKKFISDENPVNTPWDDVYTKNLLKESKDDSLLDQVTHTNSEKDIKDVEEKLLDNTNESLKETKDLNNTTIDAYSSNKSSRRNSEESAVKSNAEEKTENTTKAFDKAKLLAAMKAIDDNENIEFVEQKSRKNSAANRLKITENLYRGIPTHSRKKSEIMKELFAETKLDNNKNSKEN